MLAYTPPLVPSQAYEAATSSSSSLQEIYPRPFGLNITLELQQSTMAPPTLKSGRFKRRNRVCKTLTQLGSHTAPPASSRLPDEIFSQIARYALGHVWSDLDVMDPSSSRVKPPFARIEGMTRASRRLRAVALPEWFRLFIVRHVDDWIWAGRLRGMRAWVRHIICPPHALEQPAPSTVLSSFPHLRSAALSMSCDYELNLTRFSPPRSFYSESPVVEGEDPPVFAYRQPVTTFPPAMTSLVVRSTHGSESPLLQNLGFYCPDLRTLRLGKCTMFNSCTSGKCSGDHTEEGYYGQIADGGECPFWGTFSNQHDIYFGGDNVEQYAYELAAELAPLQKLEEISLGVYLSPIASLEEHRLAHYPWRHLETSQVATQDAHLVNTPNSIAPTASTIPTTTMPTTPPPVAFPFSTSQITPPRYANPTLWSYDCSACRKAYAAPTATAERVGGLILAAALPRLRKIEWASFLESQSQEGEGYRRGTGTHEWRVVRDEVGAVLDLERVNL